jgi:hypothetical protein
MTGSWDCAEARISLGVYVLGAIDPAERALVDAHLAAAVVAIVGGVFGSLAASRAPAAPPGAIPFWPGKTTWEKVAAASHTTDAWATVDYGPERWGTVVAAQVTGIPIGTTCELYAVHPDGTRTQVMSWTTANDEGSVWYWGSLSMPSTSEGISGFQVTTGPKLLVTVPAT